MGVCAVVHKEGNKISSKYRQRGREGTGKEGGGW